ncbi:hypothetical protein GCM10009546_03230 [Actinomadura livida]|uniref:Uncharacterized protein n=2 Tax=Actinomadura livida TaxID=79909 RepID=A0ABP3NHN9_9ACTN|nr:hypothetical protein GCM10010208_29470 [Actinomadura livida]
MATFGEMTALATDHLTDLQHQLHTKRLARDLARRAVQPELARLAHVLARYHDQIANGFGDPHPHTTGLRDAANRASALIKQAEQILGTPADTEAPRSALAEKLRATSIALGCGLDLLSTHFPVNSGNDKPTATGAIITAPDTARSLLHQLSTHTATVAHLTQRTPSPANDASGLLLRAAVLSRIHSETEPRRAIIAVPFHGIPQRRPPEAGEDLTQTFAGISASIRRLSNPQTTTSVTTWRYLARAATIVCDLNLKTLQQLIYRMKELDEPDHRSAFQKAATATKQAGIKWRDIVRRWDEQTNHHGHPANGPATDASDLILRLGRLIHADPAWTPSPRASYRMKPPDELAPDLTQAARIATITLKAMDAYNTLAANHRAAINDAAVLGILHKQREHPTHLPRIPASARQLSKAYEAAEAKGLEAVTSLGQAIQPLVPDSYHTEEVQLIIRRTTAVHDKKIQARLVAADFPVPITDCLESPHAITQRPSQTPTNSRPAGNTPIT